MEPTSTATTAAAATHIGLAALLVGWLGEVGADVMLVGLSALAGCFIAMSSAKQDRTWGESIFFIIRGVLVPLVMAWAVSSVAVGVIPALDTPYAPAVVAFVLGFLSDKLNKVLNALLKKVGVNP